MDRINSLTEIFQGKRRGQTRISITNIIMTRENIRTDLDQIAEIGEFHLMVGYNVDEIT